MKGLKFPYQVKVSKRIYSSSVPRRMIRFFKQLKLAQVLQGAF